MNTFHHTGDLGDIIASLPVIRALGGGRLVISDAKFPLGHGPRESLRGARFEALRPIVDAVPYVSEIVWEDNPQGITHDIASFRSLPWKNFETLTQWQGRYFKLNLPDAPPPWLHVPHPDIHNKIVVARTHRYRTRFFPWRLITDRYWKDMIFLGLRSEYADFMVASQKHIEWVKTTNLFDAARVIAGSRLFIGGQSVLFWIAAGLGHPLIQETHDKIYTRNSVIPRPNAIYTDCDKNLERLYEELKLDKQWFAKYKVPKEQVNLSTSAGQPRRNMSTSAELFQHLRQR
jgi:hypothetical protein